MTSATLIFAGIKFEVQGIGADQLTKTSKARVEQNRRYKMPPSTTFLNGGLEVIKVKGAFAYSKKAQEDFLKLRDIQKSGEPYILVSGSGRRIGKFYLTGIIENQDNFFTDIPTVLSMELEFLEANI